MDTGRKKLNILVAIDEVPAPLWERLTPLAKVCFAREGREAYHALTSDGFDVMFLDLNLTGMDSLELRAVREGHFYTMDHTLYNQKPNARWGEAYEGLVDILYPN